MKKIKKGLLTIMMITFCIILWKPVTVAAAEKTIGNLVLMVDFAEDSRKFSTKYKGCEEVYTSQPLNGVHAYISAISDGKVQINSFFPQDTGNSFVSITLPGKSTDYTKEQEAIFIGNVVTAVNNLVDQGTINNITSGLDSGNSEGYIDNVTFLVQVESAPDKTLPFYPHKQDVGAGTWKLFGKDVVVYNIVPSSSLWVNDEGRYDGWGYSTVSHELLHSLGAPDLYRTNGDMGEPVGIWDHMAATATPANYPLVYTRKDLGWIPEEDIPTLTQSGDYTLMAATNHSGTRAYILKTQLSSSEFFVVEYREKKERGADYSAPYDNMLPESGLIVYRVNNSVDQHTNAAGDNYMYVFRPGTQDSKGAHETYQPEGSSTTANAVLKAAVGTASRPSLGSADMNAPCTDDTIFYDDGTNSGIVISNVSLRDGEATFHVEFPELSQDSYWLPQGESISGMNYPVLTGSSDGSKLYLAGIRTVNYKAQGVLYAWQDNNWAQQTTFDADSVYDILYTDAGVTYIAYGYAGKICVAKFENNTWTAIYQQDGVYAKATLAQAGNSIWTSFYTGNTLDIVNVNDNSRLQPLTVGSSSIGNPSAYFYNGKWYAVYSDFFASGDGAKGKIACYDTTNSTWNNIYTIEGVDKMQGAETCVAGNKVYIVAKNSAQGKVFLTWDGMTFAEQSINNVNMSTGFQLMVKDQIPYIIWTKDTELHASYLKDGAWTELANKITSDANMFDAFCANGTMYVVSSSIAPITTVQKMKAVEGTPDPTPTPTPTPTPKPTPPPTPTPKPQVTEPEVGNGNVVLALPTGYDRSARLYIDGVEFSGTAWQSDESKRLISIGSTGPLGTTAQTAMAVQYNASGIPTGMYVWSLSYNGSYYTATAIPEFENLFSYHGFSVRYTGNTGLRCTFGIDSAKKQQLTGASGLHGYRIKEIGTLIMRPDLYTQYPMVYGSSKLGGGKTYGVINGRFSDKVIRRVTGRDQFANVLTNLPPARYNTAYIFRPYTVMEKDGSNVVIYGPEMSRSMYTVCKQILNRGDFRPGTSGYNFLKNIVDSVEK